MLRSIETTNMWFSRNKMKLVNGDFSKVFKVHILFVCQPFAFILIKVWFCLFSGILCGGLKLEVPINSYFGTFRDYYVEAHL